MTARCSSRGQTMSIRPSPGGARLGSALARRPLTSHDVNVTGWSKSSTRRGWPASDASSTRPLARPTAMSPISQARGPFGNPLSPYAATKLANEIYARSMRAATIPVNRPCVISMCSAQAGSGWALCGGATEVDRGNARRPAARVFGDGSTAATFATLPMRSRRICARRSLPTRPGPGL